MQTMMQSGSLIAGSNCWTTSCTDLDTASSVQCVSGSSFLGLKRREQFVQMRLSADHSKLSCSRDLRRLQGLVVRAKQPLEEDVIEEDVINGFFQDVPVSKEEASAKLENVSVELQEIAESAEENETKTTEIVPYEPRTGSAHERIAEALQDGIEILKWAGEGIVSATQTSGQGLEAAKGVIDKRLKSLNIAAEEAKAVGQKVATAAQNTFMSWRKSTSKFNEELTVNIGEKQAADSLKPESELQSPLTKVGQEIHEKFSQATAEDAPLGKLSRTVSENVSKATAVTSEKWQEISSTTSQKFSELSSSASKTGEDLEKKGEDLESDASEKMEDVTDQVKKNAEEVENKAKPEK